MKKTYINPSMKVREMKHRSTLLAGSVAGYWDTNLDPTKADSRRMNWDDEEEEDW